MNAQQFHDRITALEEEVKKLWAELSGNKQDAPAAPAAPAGEEKKEGE